MKKEGALFDLIKSLTKSEKRFIKLYGSRYTLGEKNNYLTLFDFIDKLKEYDEEKLKEKVSKSSFAGNFRGIKSYLYFLILDCLDFYHKDSSIDRRISKHINIARLLSEKRLDEQSDKVIEKTRKLSEEFNRFENIISLNSLKKDTGFKRETISIEKIQSYYQESFSAAEDIKIKLQYNKLYDELLYKRLEIGMIENKSEKKKLKIFFNTTHFKNPPKSKSFDANMFFLLSKIECSRILTDAKNGSIYIRKLIELFDKNTNRITDNVDHYIYAYALNVFTSEGPLPDDREAADTALKKISSIPSLIGEKTVSHDVRVQVFQVYYTLLTHVALIFRDYATAVPHVRRFETEKKKFEKYFTPSFHLCMQVNIACVYFGLGQYKSALKWCNEALAHPPKTRDDVMYIVRILSLLIHYELDNRILLSSLIKSTYSYLKKIKKDNQFATIFLKLIRLLVNVETKKEQKILFTQFKSELIPLLGNKFENDVFYSIDIVGWIDKKMKHAS